VSRKRSGPALLEQPGPWSNPATRGRTCPKIPSPPAEPTETIDTLIAAMKDAAPADTRLYARAVARHFEEDISAIGEDVARLGDRMIAFVDALTTKEVR
jgi:hypothetical protein